MNLTAFKGAIATAVWGTGLGSMARPRRFWVRSARVLHMLVREFMAGEIPMRAGSLVFTSLLSLVPLLAVSFSVLKSFGVHNTLEALLLPLLEPLGEQRVELVSLILAFVENTSVSALGSFGFAALFVTAVSVVLKTEAALNYVWRVRTPRPLRYRVPGYLSVLLVGPVFVMASTVVIASVKSSETVQQLISVAPVGVLLNLASRLVPYVLVSAAFTMVYLFIPNRTVRVRAALLGGATAGLAWSFIGWGFADFITSSPSYTAVYKSFAILFVFILWLYVVWIIVLLGAAVAFYSQHPEYRYLASEANLPSNRVREQLAVEVMALTAQRYLKGLRPISMREMERLLEIPEDVLLRTIRALQRAELLAETIQPRHCFLPARDVGSIHVGEIIEVARSQGNLSQLPIDSSLMISTSALKITETAVQESTAPLSLKALVEEAGPTQQAWALAIESDESEPPAIDEPPSSDEEEARGARRTGVPE